MKRSRNSASRQNKKKAPGRILSGGEHNQIQNDHQNAEDWTGDRNAFNDFFGLCGIGRIAVQINDRKNTSKDENNAYNNPESFHYIDAKETPSSIGWGGIGISLLCKKNNEAITKDSVLLRAISLLL